MKILINDDQHRHERLIKIFQNAGYERNELILCSSYEQCSNFILRNLEIEKCHIDLIVTNNHPNARNNQLNAEGLVTLKNFTTESYSNGNFRISSIPVLLYSESDSKSDTINFPFDAIVKIKDSFEHPYFISKVEELIKNWRIELCNDFNLLGLSLNNKPYFKTAYSKSSYDIRVGRNQESFFYKTVILSKEFIANPTQLNNDWLTFNESNFEQILFNYHSTFTNHIKYNRYNNERTILHEFFRSNPSILLRGSYTDYLYEKQFKDIGKTRQACDFILQTNIPEYLSTTFFEVKKEDVKLMVAKQKKRTQLSSEFSGYAGQLWDYKKYSQNSNNESELSNGIGYKTNRFTYQLLAGRSEEKEEFLDVFNERMSDHYPELEAITFDELEELNVNILNRFKRLTFNIM